MVFMFVFLSNNEYIFVNMSYLSSIAYNEASIGLALLDCCFHISIEVYPFKYYNTINGTAAFMIWTRICCGKSQISRWKYNGV